MNVNRKKNIPLKRKQNLTKSERNGGKSLTMITLMEELDTIRLVPLYINDNENSTYISTSGGSSVKKLLSSFWVINSLLSIREKSLKFISELK